MKTLREAILRESLFNKKNLDANAYNRFYGKSLNDFYEYIEKIDTKENLIIISNNPSCGREVHLLIPNNLKDVIRFIGQLKSSDFVIDDEIKKLTNRNIEKLLSHQNFFIFFFDILGSRINIDYGIYKDWSGVNKYYYESIIESIILVKDVFDFKNLYDEIFTLI